MTHVLALCGSRRDESATRAALGVALAAAEAAGASTELFDLRTVDLPPLDADRDAADQGDGAQLLAAVDAADAVVLGTPVYHGSYSGVLKNALDYCGFDEFEGKTVGLLGVAGGSFPVTALDHLRSVCRALDCWVLPHQAAIPRASQHVSYAGGEGRITSDDLDERVRVLGRRVVQYATIEPEPATFEAGENLGADD
ncbi:NADPH-dependent FMN reductase [Salinigranum halophilum]|jgi:NAD(P)H-dependent FMN reductase|uniref:NADPH-dependent FMN reductase n=1 Tax=Salinigranum halophilum TaxID=2565931 RepID=UPI00115ED09B|nr:NADPH-dependent FMN reductase [Salinigranum halophilum]